MEISIRTARHADVPAMARLHFKMWRETYRDLAPEIAFQVQAEPVWLSRWQKIFSRDRSECAMLLGEVKGHLAGFGVAGPPSRTEFLDRAEVRFLYVDSAFKRLGVGRALLVKLARAMINLGYHSMALGVVVGNNPAIKFYEALGGRRAGVYTDSGPVWRSENYLYVWDDLIRLATSEPAGTPIQNE